MVGNFYSIFNTLFTFFIYLLHFSGFSNTACRILDALNTPFETVNVLEDDRIRNGKYMLTSYFDSDITLSSSLGIKIYSSWPTIPQLYINGEFIGGSDIMVQLYQSGELAEMIEVANAN
jgi:monothiol glutaredoxin